MIETLHEMSLRLQALLDDDPEEAIRQAQQLDLSSPQRFNLMAVQAAIFVDGGGLTNQPHVVDDGIAILRELFKDFPVGNVAYNLANGLVTAVGQPRFDIPEWLEDQERTAEQRAEARKLYWRAIHDVKDAEHQTQAWTNLANQLSRSFRLGEAHDARIAALKVDPRNGVAAFGAVRDLMWLFQQGGCSDLTRVEAIHLAKIAKQDPQKLVAYAGALAAREIMRLADELGEPPTRSHHTDPFIQWVEQERLTLSPAVELVDPQLGKIDWLMLPGIRERDPSAAASPPPIFAMFNVLKSDFILARDLAWRALEEDGWPSTGRFADTLDFATYGPNRSALVLAHRTALDLLDKVAVTANHYFGLGLQPSKVYFGKIWREQRGGGSGPRPLLSTVRAAIEAGARALYGLVELADDYETEGAILRSQKDLRNAGTHRFVVLHDIGDGANSRKAPEVEHRSLDEYTVEVLGALRVARSAIQTLAFAVAQYERQLDWNTLGFTGTLIVPDHDQIRGRDEGTRLGGSDR